MKFSSHIAATIGVVCLAAGHAQGRPSTLNQPNKVDLSGAAVWAETISRSPLPYGSGGHPFLQAALVDLYAAQSQLNQANPTAKGEYLPRAIQGVQMAIVDVKAAMDFSDGRPMTLSSPGALPNLPPGVGNPDSGLEVVLTNNPKFASPAMDVARENLQKAVADLKGATPGNKGVFLSRALAEVNFAVDNANAGVNLANGYPPSQPKRAEKSSPATEHVFAFGVTEIVGGLVVVLVLILIVFEQVMRTRGRE